MAKPSKSARLASLEKSLADIQKQIANLSKPAPVGRAKLDNSRNKFKTVGALPWGIWKEIVDALNEGMTIRDIFDAYDGEVSSLVIYRIKHPKIETQVIYTARR